MGWKTFKAHFGIEHIVQVVGNDVLIGSPYVSDLIKVSTETGELVVNPTFARVLNEYPALRDASPRDILALLAEPDHFEQNLVVYTFDYLTGAILEKQCEALGYPNVTHDGMLMYENRFSQDERKVARWAIASARSGVEMTCAAITRLESQLADCLGEKARCESSLARLAAAYPDLI